MRFKSQLLATTGRIVKKTVFAILTIVILSLFATDAQAYWRLQWVDNSTNESGFRIERKIKNQGYKIIGQTNANTVTYDDTTSVAGTQYCYRLVAFNQYGTTIGPQTCVKQPR